MSKALSLPEVVCTIGLVAWTLGECHQHVEKSSLSWMGVKELGVLEAKEKQMSQFEAKSLQNIETQDMESRAALVATLERAGLSFLEFPEIKTLLNPISELSRQMILEQRAAMMAALPSIAPAEGWLASGFGGRNDPWTKTKGEHKGLDISNVEGTVIRAPADGYIRYAARYGGFGNYISIVHGFGLVTKYGHLKEVRVKAGQPVKRGDIIALMGSTGKSTGTHLHYEVWVNDKPFNPYAFMPKVMQQNARVATDFAHRMPDNLPVRQAIEVASSR